MQFTTSLVTILVIAFESALAISITEKDVQNMAQAERNFSATELRQAVAARQKAQQ